MKTNQIVEIYEHRIPGHILDFLDAMTNVELHFTSKSLEHIYRSEEELDLAIQRAMRICRTVGLPLDRHFRQRYISDEIQHTLKHDWRMSKVAYCLTLVNGDPDHPFVGRIQWELVKKVLDNDSC